MYIGMHVTDADGKHAKSRQCTRMQFTTHKERNATQNTRKKKVTCIRMKHTTTALKERNATYNIHEESYIHAKKKFTCTLKHICSQELRTVNPAVRPSDQIEQFPARAYLGGALDMAHFPLQCPGGGSGDHRCTGLARDCAQCYDGSGHCFPRIHGSGSIQLTKTDGRGSLKSYYYLNIRGTIGHDLVVLLR